MMRGAKSLAFRFSPLCMYVVCGRHITMAMQEKETDTRRQRSIPIPIHHGNHPLSPHNTAITVLPHAYNLPPLQHLTIPLNALNANAKHQITHLNIPVSTAVTPLINHGNLSSPPLPFFKSLV